MSMQAQTIIIFVGSFLFAFMSLAFVFIAPIERLMLKEWLTSGGSGAGADDKAADNAAPAAPTPKKQEEIKVPEQSFEPGAEVPEAPDSESEEAADEAEAEGEAEAESEVEVEMPSAEEEIDDADDEKATKEEVRDARVLMMKFLEGALAGLMKDGLRLDGVNRFGCHLFLAGAAEVLTRTGGLSKGQFVGVLEKCVAVLGTDRKMARQFGKKYEEYLLEPKYCDMFRSGATAMERFAEDSHMNVAAALGQALDEWSKPDNKGDSGAPIAVMFTDIVGSTRLTEEHGDDAMQKIVRAHNKIVRESLRNFAGVEVKHTGDGIMASFKSVANSVDASREMMQGIAAFNKGASEIPLEIRIGLNAGTPIAEDGDLYGTTVQISARLCDKAEDGGIAVSNLVKELAAGSSAQFTEMGELELKGVSEAVKVYSVAIN
ncbi:MAG: adenylate/guanylate cyclase domain-containing protein [Alphaproteobacteria bacterium]|jgi:adenylate cyclase|nr:adenylate/guanylate cyclase domain-containing protein [Alphaproteobacteria bacterium]MBT5161317.1 adenylate/guanylate cyclase domain-containing protein [Alphaproteobacteria bacterium]MBT5918013.1 adenylate/guanylate cyclase domain-containing protein [Alphaproteobacteria bacterium]MBT6386056.1 adenylate/guanylate cyclase domain-containing protein [Alphaproteobacteria bacterium]